MIIVTVVRHLSRRETCLEIPGQSPQKIGEIRKRFIVPFLLAMKTTDKVLNRLTAMTVAFPSFGGARNHHAKAQNYSR